MHKSYNTGVTIKWLFYTHIGRVHGIRESGSKLVFYVLQGEGVKLQVMANLQAYESNDGFYADVAKIKRGDIIVSKISCYFYF